MTALGIVFSGSSKGVTAIDRSKFGSDFDDFLRDEQMLEEAEAIARKRAIAFQNAQEKERSGGEGRGQETPGESQHLG